MSLIRTAILSIALLTVAGCASVPDNERYLLVYASNGNIAGARAMLANGADLGVVDLESGNGLLAYAAANRRNKFMQFLLDNRLDPNHRNYNGITPLMIAVSVGNYEGIRLLAERGADLDLQNYAPGFTAYMLADSNDDQQAMRLLAELGAEICAGCRHPSELDGTSSAQRLIKP